MSRSVFNIETPYTCDEIDKIVMRFMAENKFKRVLYKGGDTVWKRGDDFFVRGMFLAVVAEDGSVHIEAWVKSFGEQGLGGLLGVVPKRILKSYADKLIASLCAVKDT